MATTTIKTTEDLVAYVIPLTQTMANEMFTYLRLSDDGMCVANVKYIAGKGPLSEQRSICVTMCAATPDDDDQSIFVHASPYVPSFHAAPNFTFYSPVRVDPSAW